MNRRKLTREQKNARLAMAQAHRYERLDKMHKRHTFLSNQLARLELRIRLLKEQIDLK